MKPISLNVFSHNGVEPWEGFQWAGAWVVVLPVPGIGDVVLDWTTIPQGPGGDKFTGVSRC